MLQERVSELELQNKDYSKKLRNYAALKNYHEKVGCTGYC